MWEKAKPLKMTNEQRTTLEAWGRAKTSPQRTVLRARICLLAADGLSNNAIAACLSTSRPTGRVKAIVEATLQTIPRDATHWSVRSMAKAKGVGKSTVQRIWDAHGLKPHRVETFKLSKDKRFVEKLTDVVGVYLNPPDKAVVLC